MIKHLTLAEAQERWPDPRKSAPIKPISQSIYWMSPRGVMSLEGSGPPHQVTTVWPGSVLHSRWSSEPFNSHNLPRSNMKPGPYKSSTHGEIPLSLRGRELMQTIRTAVDSAVVVARREPNAAFPLSIDTETGRAVAHARGEIAKYMSEMELYAGRFFERAPRDVKHEMGEPPSTHKRPTTGTEIVNQMKLDAERDYRQTLGGLYSNAVRNGRVYLGMDLAGPALDNVTLQAANVNLKFTEETKMTDKTNGAGATPVEKTRSQLIAEATQELLVAQRNLEAIAEVPAGIPDLYINTHASAHYPMAVAVSELVTEQWDALAKKATARAKARVAKAEKAVAALVS